MHKNLSTAAGISTSQLGPRPFDSIPGLWAGEFAQDFAPRA